MAISPTSVERALAVAYAFLNRRERTEAEVRQRLARDEVEASVIDEAVSTLQEQRYLDDDRYARLFVQDRRELDGWGVERIRRTLSERGIDSETIERTVVDERDAELERALTLLRRRFPDPPRDRRERDRALGVMLRKGYDSEVAVDALRAYARRYAGAAN